MLAVFSELGSKAGRLDNIIKKWENFSRFMDFSDYNNFKTLQDFEDYLEDAYGDPDMLEDMEENGIEFRDIYDYSKEIWEALYRESDFEKFIKSITKKVKDYVSKVEPQEDGYVIYFKDGSQAVISSK